MEATVLPMVTADLPTIPVPPVTQVETLVRLGDCRPRLWNSGKGLGFREGGWESLSKAVLHGRWFSPTKAPSVFKTRTIGRKFQTERAK